jgi:hypothetical protein
MTYKLLSHTTRSRTNHERVVPASNFVGTVAANVDNKKMSDADFRVFIRNTLPIVQYCGADKVK